TVPRCTRRAYRGWRKPSSQHEIRLPDLAAAPQRTDLTKGAAMSVTDFFDRGWRANPTGAAFSAGNLPSPADKTETCFCRVENARRAGGVGRDEKGLVRPETN